MSDSSSVTLDNTHAAGNEQTPPHVVVVGGGVSGLATAWYLHQLTSARVTVLEATDRVGGALGSDRIDGFLLEHAADQFLVRPNTALDLCSELGLDDEMTTSRPIRPPLHLFARGKLRAVPKGMSLVVPTDLWAFLRSDLLTPWGKLRVLLEPLVPRRDVWDESMESFLRRRMGDELTDVVADTLLSGIYSGYAKDLSIFATFPRFPKMVADHGSLLLAGLKMARQGPPPSPDGRKTHSPFRSFNGGMGTLINALADALAPFERVDVRLSSPVADVQEHQQRFTLGLRDGSRLDADAVVLALPAHHAAGMVEAWPALKQQLDGIPYTSSGGVYLAYDDRAAPYLPETIGMLMPRNTTWTIRGISLASKKFADRAPEGHHLVRVFIGGEGHTALLDETDETIVQRVRDDLKRLLGLDVPPVMAHVRRYMRQTPQYLVGHQARVARVRAATPAGVYLTGNAYDGVGVPACVDGARRTALAIQARATAATAQG